MFEYPINMIKEDNNSFTVNFPDIPEAWTFGNDIEEAKKRAVDALETALDIYMGKKWPLPRASKEGEIFVRPSPLSIMKLSIYQEMIESNLKKTDLARVLGCHLPQIDRILDLNHSSKFEQLQTVLNALKKEVFIEIRKAA